ncbi:hypothetical protein [Sphingomonas jatrophae]|uniref:hypothetical protein n=1 Tax=Sphingomonas jatrophae TaxID=1166337 RepID=UPI0013F4C257|nr:hypothetical protein [Sphingomonas jatrophae]
MKKPAARWTLDRQARFLEALAAGCNVAKACRTVGVSDTSVYRLRMKSPAFREAWAIALHEGYVRLEMMMLERAIDGVEKPVFHGGKEVARVREFDARLAGQLLAQHQRAAVPPVVAAAEPGDAIRARLAARFEEMAERMTGDDP